MLFRARFATLWWQISEQNATTNVLFRHSSGSGIWCPLFMWIEFDHIEFSLHRLFWGERKKRTKERENVFYLNSHASTHTHLSIPFSCRMFFILYIFFFIQFGLDLVLAFLPSFHMSRQFFALFVFQIQFRLPHNLFIRTWWRTERTHISVVWKRRKNNTLYERKKR